MRGGEGKVLLDENFVELVENPDHKRSLLVQMTPPGRSCIKAMKKREHQIYLSADWGVSERAMNDAIRVLRKMRETLLKQVSK